MTSLWRRYNIFLSSTFKDMDFERDIIKFKVIPNLNRRFRDRCIELQAIDLRLGVNTSDMGEEESERKVLSVCTSCINSARPFFIGLIGARYGWVPPEERWKEFIAKLPAKEQGILANTMGCSVTEMEIVYGALSKESFDTSHVLFYLRDEASYANVPEELRASFCDTSDDSISRLALLKEKIIKLFGSYGGADDRCTQYHINFNAEKNCFEGDLFEKLVTQQLAEQIERETAREETEALPWWQEEAKAAESELLRHLANTIDRTPFHEKDCEILEDEDSVVNKYYKGYGASTLLAQRYAKYRSDHSICLIGIFGLTEHSTSMRGVMTRWIFEVADRLGKVEMCPDDMLDASKVQFGGLVKYFKELINTAKDKGLSVYMFLDNLESLEGSSPSDLFLSWIDEEMQVYINSRIDGSYDKVREHGGNLFGVAQLSTIDTQEEAEAFIEAYEKEYYLEVPKEIRALIMEEVNERNGIIPLKLRTAFHLFQSLTQEDFARIRATSGNQIDSINNYLTHIYDELPDMPDGLMSEFLRKLDENFGFDGKSRSLFYLCVAPTGLRISDLEALFGDNWDEITFYRLMNFLQDFFQEDTKKHIWRSRYSIPDLVDETAENSWLPSKQHLIEGLAHHVSKLPDDDTLKTSMGLYYVLLNGDVSLYESVQFKGNLMDSSTSTLSKQFGPETKFLASEGWFTKERLGLFMKSLDPSIAISLAYILKIALYDDSKSYLDDLIALSEVVACIPIKDLSASDLFLVGIIMMNNYNELQLQGNDRKKRKKIGTYLELGLEALQRCHELAGANYYHIGSIIPGYIGLLIQHYRVSNPLKAAKLSIKLAQWQKKAHDGLPKDNGGGLSKDDAIDLLLSLDEELKIVHSEENKVDEIIHEAASIMSRVGTEKKPWAVYWTLLERACMSYMDQKLFKKTYSLSVRTLHEMSEFAIKYGSGEDSKLLEILCIMSMHAMLASSALSMNQECNISTYLFSIAMKKFERLDPHNTNLGIIRKMVKQAGSQELFDNVNADEFDMSELIDELYDKA